MKIDFEKVGFDVTKDFTLEDLAESLGCSVDDIARNLEEAGYIDFNEGVTVQGKSKMPGLRFPKWPSGKYGHWDAEDYYKSHKFTPATLAYRYGLRENMDDSDWKVALGRAERDAEAYGILLHGVENYFNKVLNGGWESDALAGIEWIILRKNQEKWSLPEWVAKIRAADKPWRIYLNREDLGEEIVVLDAKQFHELARKVQLKN